MRETIWSVWAGLVTLALVFGVAACGELSQAARAGRVTEVVDGDTVVVAGIGTVRYIGVDTPELHHPRKPVQRFASRARAANRALVERRIVRVIPGAEPHDAYGRTLAYVYVGDTMVNAELVRRGYARTLTIAPNDVNAGLFHRLEQQARQAGRGLWGPGEGGPPWGPLD